MDNLYYLKGLRTFDLKFLRGRFLNYIEKNWELNNHNLQKTSCVYVMVSYDCMGRNGDIVYVGSTTNIYARYKSHKVPAKIQATGNLNLMYYMPMTRGFYDYEIKLIRRLKPLFNRQHKNGTT